MDPEDTEHIEINLFLEAIYLRYGYDFRRYARNSMKRRILRILFRSGFKNISEMQHELINNEHFFLSILPDFSVNVTEMFRDPVFYSALRRNIVPVLRKSPFLKIWHAGCATGEEVYSMAILLKEENLLDGAQLYATDINNDALNKAREGIYASTLVRDYETNYKTAGGTFSLQNYYTERYHYAIMDSSLKKHIVFADHNLVTDGVFGEMNLIVCRNVLIYFNRELQDRVVRLFRDSLCDAGFLALGSKESIRLSSCSSDFEDICREERIYRKKPLTYYE